jgi:hypothetical protein
MNKILTLSGILLFAFIFFQCKDSEPEPAGNDKKNIIYTDLGWNGLNVLSMNDTVFIDNVKINANQGYSFSADLEEKAVLKIVMTNLSPDEFAIWGYDISSVLGWSITDYDWVENKQDFFADKTSHLDLSIIFYEKGSCRIDYYENNDTAATRTKFVTWE